jgi:hypothetical protein
MGAHSMSETLEVEVKRLRAQIQAVRELCDRAYHRDNLNAMVHAGSVLATIDEEGTPCA